MPKKNITINKTNQARIAKWIKHLQGIENKEQLHEWFTELIIRELKLLKDCIEKSVVEYYIETADDYAAKLVAGGNTEFKKEYLYDDVVPLARVALAKKYTANQTFDNNIDIYFNEVKREYILHPMNESDDLEFLPENKDIFIKNNLKLVINCAKRYRNLGLPFEDLIQVGNLGLLTAFEKFNTEKSNLQNNIKKNIRESSLEVFSHDEAIEVVKAGFTYDKDLQHTISRIPETGFSSKEEFLEWTTKNVKKAVFASVAFIWVRAFILSELSSYSKIVRIPNNVGQEDIEGLSDEDIAEMSCKSKGSYILSLDSVNPVTEDNYHDGEIADIAQEAFLIEDDAIDRENNEVEFKRIIGNVLAKLSDFDRRIIKKRFGIGFPNPLSINEIAESEGLPPNKIKYVINICLRELKKFITEKDEAMLLEMLS